MLLFKKDGNSQFCRPRTGDEFLIKSKKLNLRSSPSLNSFVKMELDPVYHLVEVKNEDSLIDNFILVYVLFSDSFSKVKQESIINKIDSGFVYLSYLELNGDSERFIFKSVSLSEEDEAEALETIRIQDSLYNNKICYYNPSKIAFAYRKLGDISSFKIDYKQAIVYYKNCIELSTEKSIDERVISLFNRANAKIILNDYYGAIKDLKQLLLYKSQVFIDHNLLDWGVKYENYAIPTYNYLIDLESVYLKLIVCYASINEFITALQYVDIILKNNSSVPLTFFSILVVPNKNRL